MNKIKCERCGSLDNDIELTEYSDIQDHVKMLYGPADFPRMVTHCNDCQHELIL